MLLEASSGEPEGRGELSPHGSLSSGALNRGDYSLVSHHMLGGRPHTERLEAQKWQVFLMSPQEDLAVPNKDTSFNTTTRDATVLESMSFIQ